MEDIDMNISNITNYKTKDFAKLSRISINRKGILKANIRRGLGNC